MTKKRVTPFTVGPAIVFSWAGTVLPQVDARFVPTMIHRLEVYKMQWLYASEAAYADGLDAVNKQQEALLMDIGDRIIREVRATRMGGSTDLAAQDPQLDPFTLDLTSLVDLKEATDEVGRTLVDVTQTTNDLLQEIRNILVDNPGGETGVIERLDTLILLLGAV